MTCLIAQSNRLASKAVASGERQSPPGSTPVDCPILLSPNDRQCTSAKSESYKTKGITTAMKRTVIIVSLCLALSAQAATYYCDAAQTGTNHAGTDADPYSEADLLSKSLEVQWQPGDAIYCKGAFGNIISPDQTYGSAGGGYVT